MSYRVQLIISEDVESQQFGTNVINKVINPALSINSYCFIIFCNSCGV